MNNLLKHIVFTLPMLILAWACSSENFYIESDAELSFSSDTIAFDTVFSSIGSATQIFSVRNMQKMPIKLSTIKVANPNSYFHINVDGCNSNLFEDVEIKGNDSIFIFVQVKVDPQNQNSPVFIEDSIIFDLNGKSQSVLLHAHGQDVHLLKGEIISESTVWPADRPYLIYDSLYVLPGARLTIEAGSIIYCHKDAAICIWGNIDVKGSVEAPVEFRGDRLDLIYDGYAYDKTPGQWYGMELYSLEGSNSIENCSFRNAIFALKVGDYQLDHSVKLDLKNSIIHNNTYAGMIAFDADITAKNCEFTNCGNFNLYLSTGGTYNFYHCTIANYYGIDPNTKKSEKPSLIISNVVQDGDLVYVADLKEANFVNCIVDGLNTGETAAIGAEGYSMNLLFNNSALKIEDIYLKTFPNSFVNCIYNDSIKFAKIKQFDFDFSLDTLSEMRDRGNLDLIISDPDLEFDINGTSRIADGKPDLGAYEFVLKPKETGENK